jgi:hypothetical protein
MAGTAVLSRLGLFFPSRGQQFLPDMQDTSAMNSSTAKALTDTFVPMVWGTAVAPDMSFLKDHEGDIMGYNEPDLFGPACCACGLLIPVPPVAFLFFFGWCVASLAARVGGEREQVGEAALFSDSNLSK